MRALFWLSSSTWCASMYKSGAATYTKFHVKLHSELVLLGIIYIDRMSVVMPFIGMQNKGCLLDPQGPPRQKPRYFSDLKTSPQESLTFMTQMRIGSLRKCWVLSQSHRIKAPRLKGHLGRLQGATFLVPSNSGLDYSRAGIPALLVWGCQQLRTPCQEGHREGLNTKVSARTAFCPITTDHPSLSGPCSKRWPCVPKQQA